MKESKKIHLSIFKNILLKDGYITTKELAETIGVSSKTITNYMNKVFDLAKDNNVNLLSKKSMGYIIENDFYLKQSIANGIKTTDTMPYFKEERKLFLLHTLLTSDEELRIPYIEYLLHISRPSIYKCLDDIDDWLKKYKMVLHKRNYRGIFIEQGEKRHRLAIIDWYIETKKFIDIRKKSNDYSDSLNLEKYLNYYNLSFDESVIKNTIYEIQSFLGFKCVKSYLDKLQIILKISLLRIVQNHLITLSNKRKELVKSLDINSDINKIIVLIHKNFDVSINIDEASYLFSLILAGDTSHKKKVIQSNSLNRIDYKALVKELKQYLDNNINVNDNTKDIFIEKLKTDLESILIYQIDYDTDCNLEFAIIKDKYPILYKHSLNILDIIQNHTQLYYSEKFITNITYLLANLIFKAKRKIKALFIHNCNMSELEFILSKLNMYLVEVDIKDIYECRDPDLKFKDSDFDLILTTHETQLDTSIKVLVINCPLSHCDIIYYNSIVHDYYEEFNQRNILINEK